MNKLLAQGNLVAAASITAGKNNRDVLSFTIACNEGKTQAGDEIVEFVPVVAYGKKGFADNIKEYLGKGASVTAVGRLVLTKNEKDAAVYTNARCEVQKLRDIRLGNSKSTTAPAAGSDQVDPAVQEQNQVATTAAANSAPLPTPDYDSFDDDIPF